MRFWENKSLTEMSETEWESLCDHCGKCCLVKLEDEDSGEIAVTKVVCKLIDLKTSLCKGYSKRCELVPDCINLKQHDFAEYKWLPATCAYRLLAYKKSLPSWHPLLTGTFQSVQDAGESVIGYAVKESELVDPEDHNIAWLD